MAIKRLRLQEFEDNSINKNKKRLETQDTKIDSKMEDWLTNLPDSLQLRILSALDAKYAVQTCVLSRSWASSWKSVPILELNSYGFKRVRDFDRFVRKVLCQRDHSVKLDTLTFIRDKVSSSAILTTVMNYAFSRGVKHLDVRVDKTNKNRRWPSKLHCSSDSLLSLKLVCDHDVCCPYLGPRSRLFKSLSVLHLKNAVISDQDPFSGFPVLSKLTLVGCRIFTDGYTLNIKAQQLSELAIVLYNKRIDRIELITPKLKVFDYRGLDFGVLKTCNGFPLLDSIVVGYSGLSRIENKETFDDLVMFFNKAYNVKSLKVCSTIVNILKLYREKLMSRCLLFRDLKFDFEDFSRQKLFKSESNHTIELFEVTSVLKDYLPRKLTAVKIRTGL